MIYCLMTVKEAGRKGGHERAKVLSKARRIAIAIAAAHARWSGRKTPADLDELESTKNAK